MDSSDDLHLALKEVLQAVNEAKLEVDRRLRASKAAVADNAAVLAVLRTPREPRVQEPAAEQAPIEVGSCVWHPSVCVRAATDL